MNKKCNQEDTKGNNYPRLAIIGAGNMASCIVGGLVNSNDHNYFSDNITVSGPKNKKLSSLQQQFGITINTNNSKACKEADIVILAVKPQVIKMVVAEIKPVLTHRPLVISVAAGITSRQLTKWLGEDIPVVRAMPNTPALVRNGATGLYANTVVSRQQREQAESILSAIGYTTWVEEESLMDALTAVSGSGPAYFFLLMEAMIDAGVKQGLTQSIAKQLTLQTALGAAALAKSSDVDVAELRRRVTSPGGTTEQAIQYFQQANFAQIVTDAMDACAERSRQLAKAFD